MGGPGVRAPGEEGEGVTRAVLWDLDGTLVDSAEYHWRAWTAALAAEGIAITHEQFLETFGRRNDAILTGWLGAQATAERIQRVGEDKEERYRELVRAGGLAPLPGAAEWVKRLHREGWLEAIATSAPRANVETVLDVIGLARYFGAIVSAEDVRRGKPDPQVFLAAAEKLGVPPAHCIVVEDAVAGVEAGRRARMKTIGVGDRIALPADIVAPSPAALPADAFDRLLPPGA